MDVIIFATVWIWVILLALCKYIKRRFVYQRLTKMRRQTLLIRNKFGSQICSPYAQCCRWCFLNGDLNGEPFGFVCLDDFFANAIKIRFPFFVCLFLISIFRYFRAFFFFRFNSCVMIAFFFISLTFLVKLFIDREEKLIYPLIDLIRRTVIIPWSMRDDVHLLTMRNIFGLLVGGVKGSLMNYLCSRLRFNSCEIFVIFSRLSISKPKDLSLGYHKSFPSGLILTKKLTL